MIGTISKEGKFSHTVNNNGYDHLFTIRIKQVGVKYIRVTIVYEYSGVPLTLSKKYLALKPVILNFLESNWPSNNY